MYQTSWVQRLKLITDLFFSFNFSNCSTYAGWFDWPDKESFEPCLCKIGAFLDFNLCLTDDLVSLVLSLIDNVIFKKKQYPIELITIIFSFDIFSCSKVIELSYHLSSFFDLDVLKHGLLGTISNGHPIKECW